jgi:hypothetical protein
VTLREPDPTGIRKLADDAVVDLARHAAVDMHDNRAAGIGPMPRDLYRAVGGIVHQHDDPDSHAQFPFDIRPRISSWRQLMYFSDHLHHSD